MAHREAVASLQGDACGFLRQSGVPVQPMASGTGKIVRKPVDDIQLNSTGDFQPGRPRVFFLNRAG